MAYNLGFIGGGNMSTAIVEGILKTGAHPASQIWVSGPHLENLKHWKELKTNVTVKNGEVLANCDIIFWGVKPAMLQSAVKDTLNTLPYNFSCKSVLFVSMLAGTTIETLQRELSCLSKDSSIIRIMPNTPMTVGVGACLYSPDQKVTPQQCIILEKLLEGCCLCEKVPEYQIDALGALTACGPAFVCIVIEAFADGAVKHGIPRATALKFAAQTVMGTGQMVLKTGKHPSVLKDEVCSPGGSTIAGVHALEDGKMRATLINAMDAAIARTKEMRNNH